MEEFNSIVVNNAEQLKSSQLIDSNTVQTYINFENNESFASASFCDLQVEEFMTNYCEHDENLHYKINNGISCVLTEIIEKVVVEDVNQRDEITFFKKMKSIQSDNANCFNSTESYRVAIDVVNDILNNLFKNLQKDEPTKKKDLNTTKHSHESDVVSQSDRTCNAIHSHFQQAEEYPSIELVDFNLAQSASMIHCLQCPVETCRYVTINLDSFEKHITIDHSIEKQCLEFFACSSCNALSNVHSILQEHCEIYHASDAIIKQEKTKRKRGRPRKIPDLTARVGPDVAMKEYIACLDEEDRVMSLCPECGRCFEKQESLHKHMRIHHREDSDWQPEDSSVATRAVRRHSSNASAPGVVDTLNDKTVSLRRHGRAAKRSSADYQLYSDANDDTNEDSTGECTSLRQRRDASDVEEFMLNDPEKLLHSRRRTRGRPRKPPLSVATLDGVAEAEADRQHCCKQCDSVFCTWSQLWQHVRDVHWQGKRIFVCPEATCGKPFRNSYKLQLHRRIHAPRKRAGRRRYSCEQCNKTYTSNYKLFEHMKRFHLKCGPTHTCATCGKRFFSRGALQRHDHLAHYTTCDFRCPHCDVVLLKKKLLVQHVAEQHAELQQEQHKCSLCARTFKYLATLQRHLLSHSAAAAAGGSGNVLLKCGFCSLSNFESAKDLERHFESHHEGTRPYLCEHCGKTFATGAHLQRHSVVHTTEKNFRCELCAKAFLRVDKLRRHELSVHSAERPHLCHLCGKGFARKDKLTEHIKQHNREASIPCDVCGDLFVMKSALNKHKRQVHDIKAHRSPRVQPPPAASDAKKSRCKATSSTTSTDNPADATSGSIQQQRKYSLDLDAVMVAAAAAGIGESSSIVPKKQRRQSRKAKPPSMMLHHDFGNNTSSLSNQAPYIIPRPVEVAPSQGAFFTTGSIHDLNAASQLFSMDFPLNLMAAASTVDVSGGSEHQLLQGLAQSQLQHHHQLASSNSSAATLRQTHLFNAGGAVGANYHQFISLSAAPNFDASDAAAATNSASFRSAEGLLLSSSSDSLRYSSNHTSAAAMMNSFRPS